MDCFNISIGKLVTTWCTEVLMPRHEVEGFDITTSLGCTFGVPLLASIFVGNKVEMERYNLLDEPNCRKLTKWIKDYYLKCDTFDGLIEYLDWVSGIPVHPLSPLADKTG